MSNFKLSIGTITAFAGSEDKIDSNKWFLCNGQMIDKTKYKDLFDIIGTSWGGVGANEFAVPDLRGLFLRGVSMASGIDQDCSNRNVSRTDLSAQGNKGNNVGSKQEDIFESHNHQLSSDHHLMDNDLNSYRIIGSNGQANDVIYGRTKLSITNNGGNETRPKNAYVHYLIRHSN